MGLKLCPSCPPATSPLCTLVQGLGCVPPHCLSRPEWHQPWEGGQTGPGAQRLRLWLSPGPLWLTQPFVSGLYQALGENKEKDSSHYRIPGMEGTSVVTPCLSRSAVLSSKIERCPAKAEVFWGCHPGHCTLGPDAAERETAAPSPHTRMPTCPLRCGLRKGPSLFVT